MRFLRQILFGVFLIFVSILPAIASPGIAVYVDGTPVMLDQPPIIENGRTLVPLRGIFENLGAQVNYESASKKITASKSSTTVQLFIGQIKAYKNGSLFYLDVPARVVNGRTLVPLRFISEAFGANVNWNAQTKTIFVISTSPLPPSESIPKLSNLIALPKTIEILVGEAKDLQKLITIVGTDQKGANYDYDQNDLIWSTSDALAVNLSGNIMTPLKIGAFEIKASLGKVISNPIMVIVKESPALSALQLVGTIPSLNTGETFSLQNLLLNGLDQNNNPFDITRQTITFESSNNDIASVTGNTLLAVKAGKAQIRAKAGNVSSNWVDLSINPPVLASLQLSGAAPIITVNGPVYDLNQLILTGGDQSGNPFDLSESTVAWDVGNAAIASISGSTIAGRAQGNTTAVARIGTIYSNPITVSVHSAELSAQEISQLYSPAIVTITVYIDQETPFGSGSGFVVDQSGVVVTNYHVIEEANSAQVTLTNGTTYEVLYVIGYNRQKDLAVLKIDGNNLPTVKLGNSDQVMSGEEVYTIGSPKGFDNTIAGGLVSNSNRVIDGQRYIQTSAPISVGSSGGALINSLGEVIGVTSMTIIDSQNLNLAIPINEIKPLLTANVNITLSELYTPISDPQKVVDTLEANNIAFTDPETGSTVHFNITVSPLAINDLMFWVYLEPTDYLNWLNLTNEQRDDIIESIAEDVVALVGNNPFEFVVFYENEWPFYPASFESDEKTLLPNGNWLVTHIIGAASSDGKTLSWESYF